MNDRIIFDPMAVWGPGRYQFDHEAISRASTGTWPVGELETKWPEIVATLVAPVMRAAGCGGVVTTDWVRGQRGRWRQGG